MLGLDFWETLYRLSSSIHSILGPVSRPSVQPNFRLSLQHLRLVCVPATSLRSWISFRTMCSLSKCCKGSMELVQCGRALVDQTRRITQVTFQHVKAHTGLCFNEMADRVDDAARKRVRTGAPTPCLRPYVAGSGQEQVQDHCLT